MHVVGPVSVDLVIEAFRGDIKVREQNKPWPSTPSEKISLLSDAQRPVDEILRRVWSLVLFPRAEFLSNVIPVWPRPNNGNYSWPSLEAMVEAIKAGIFRPADEKWKAVEDLRDQRTGSSGRCIGELIGYQEAGRILLEEGHTRATAAALAGDLPPLICVYVGERPKLEPK